ncbi:pulmonary surfactant-associated protein A2-like isoform X2 [Ranitomeya variabilis]|uniref:pulmonary surfactant-associated protein A2-like isoform X2 n=1 Tax=Ranitomeya variabilis TaxID=490064 RepID=UPI004055FC6D
MFCHGSLLLTVVVGLASSFPQLFGSGKLPLVENIPIPLPPKVDAEIPSVSWGILDKIGLTGSPAVGGSPSELQNLNHRISRLEAVLKLEGRIQLVGDKMMATNGKEEDFATSNSSCNLIGGRIVTPMNEAENSAALVFVKKYNSYAFLGMTQGPVPGAFCYLNGTPVVFTHWRKGEPSGKGTEGCTEMYTDGQWNDKACNYKRLTICEI